MGTDFEKQITEAESALKNAEQQFGPSSVEVAQCLESCARLLRQAKVRILDAANMEARAKVIRTQNPPVNSPKQPATPNSESEADTKKCPSCAEAIKADALLCRFCKTNLKRKPMNIPTLTLGSALLMVLGVIAWLTWTSPIKRDTTSYSQAPENPLFNTVVPKSKISGAAWIVKGGGQSDIQRGLEIALCKDSVISAIVRAKQKVSDDFGKSGLSAHGYYGLLAALPNMSKAVGRDAVKLVKTDVDGKYLMTNIRPGHYCLYAAYTTNFSAAYWLIPVTIAVAEEVKIDFENGNIMESHNKSDY